jgi:hypothetical protein
MKDKLKNKETEIRNLKLRLSLSTDKIEELIEEIGDVQNLKSKVK